MNETYLRVFHRKSHIIWTFLRICIHWYLSLNYETQHILAGGTFQLINHHPTQSFNNAPQLANGWLKKVNVVSTSVLKQHEKKYITNLCWLSVMCIYNILGVAVKVAQNTAYEFNNVPFSFQELAIGCVSCRGLADWLSWNVSNRDKWTRTAVFLLTCCLSHLRTHLAPAINPIPIAHTTAG